MNSRNFSILWGILLIAAGGLFLADNLGTFPAVPPLLWAMVFAGASALFCAGYLVSGIHAWGWLFPAAITAAIAATIFLAWLGIGGAFIATLFLWAIGLPFLVGFALDYPRSWPLAIPSYALFAIGGLVLLAGWIPGELFVALVMLAIALPFAIAFLMDREKWWALIPAGAMVAVAVFMVGMATVGPQTLGAVVLAAMALPFWVVYVRSGENWWALIPGGILGTLAVAALLTGIDAAPAITARLTGGVVLGGMAATFAVLWLQRHNQPTDWAKYPAAFLGTAALLAVVFGPAMNILWPLALLAAGGWLVLSALRRRAAPVRGPAAGQPAGGREMVPVSPDASEAVSAPKGAARWTAEAPVQATPGQ